jgi:exonuclease III
MMGCGFTDGKECMQWAKE